MIEICCGSYEDAINAYKGGAKRIELNSALYLGGLTPTISTLRLVKENTDLNVVCMVRSRGAGFMYSDMEFLQMQNEAEYMLKNGADGLAFGALNNDFTLDTYKVMKIHELCSKYNKKFVLHRAYDCAINVSEILELFKKEGNTRILTSGQKKTAIEGIDHIHYMQKNYGDHIEILAGCGVTYANAEEIFEKTGVFQLHSSCKVDGYDPTSKFDDVDFSYKGMGKYEKVSIELVEKLVKKDKEVNH